MTRRLTPAERLAQTSKTTTLDAIVAGSTWDHHVVEQAVFAFAEACDEWSCNDLRDLLPEMGHGFLGAAINSLYRAGIIQHTGQYVPSTSAATRGHPIAVWRLSAKGQHIAEQRRQQQREAA